MAENFNGEIMEKKAGLEEDKIEKEMNMEIPPEIKSVMEKLEKSGYEVFAVGGCVRDLLLDRKPGDWDLCGSAKPEDIRKIFPKTFYENNFGTTTILTGSEDKTLSEIEYTPFRKEGKYSDKRHPDEIVWAEKLEDDLARRDFTVNAMALRFRSGQAPEVIDIFDGREDLEKKLIRAVGEPNERFNEDALRMLRAPRFAAQLGFEIEEKTKKAIQNNAEWLRAISKERVRDELAKILTTEKAAEGIMTLRELGLLKFILPELEEGWGVTQNKHHAYTVFEHSVRSLDFATKEGYNLEVRLAALLHDVGKPRTKTGEGSESHFYGHDRLSAKMAARIMERLKFPRESVAKVIKLIRAHMFKYNTNPALESVTTDAAVRRIIRRVGEENIWDLAKLRLADRAGSGVKKIEKFDNRHFKFRVEKLLRDPISLKQLAIGGNELMDALRIKPGPGGGGPKVGWLLNALFQEVLDDPEKNKKEYLLGRLRELDKEPDEKLQEWADAAKREMGLLEEQAEEELKEKYYVK